MDKQTLYILVTNSTILEGSTLNLSQNIRLLEDGISSEGKTILEQLKNIDLFKAYQMAIKDAEGHQVWSGYRLKSLAARALKCRGFDCNKVSDEATLQAICHEANEARMHARSLGADGLRKAAESIRSKVSGAALWPEGNIVMGRLLGNMLEFEFGLEPSGSRPARGTQNNAERILDILSKHPRYTTADLAGILHISDKGVEKHLANLKKTGRLLRVGPDKGGHWEVKRVI
ncbi:MAG: winged helix-turn-helix transcriptional regulator [Bacteroidales bacterium]|jgi:hypothetical protein|nr:winged helix-turn-helix transcriptional regulator [Bacteroidales bacterium]